VSLAVVREALTRLSGDGLAERIPIAASPCQRPVDERWQALAHARSLLEPVMLRDAVERGDLEWESRVVARPPPPRRHIRSAPRRVATSVSSGPSPTADFIAHWSKGCANSVMLDVFDRFWRASELARRCR